MSWTIRLVKDQDGLKIDEEVLSGLQNMPDGTYVLYGHEPKDGESQIATLSITHTTLTGLQIATAIASRNLQRY